MTLNHVLRGGDVVALDPGGFWTDRERAVFGGTLRPSVALAPLPPSQERSCTGSSAVGTSLSGTCRRRRCASSPPAPEAGPVQPN
ncbi:MAG TPA: hypothetical protein VLR26_07160, partial [Frankiaceae bacterium]|nr:hypothetical protein [Frankiaceae bacterium]